MEEILASIRRIIADDQSMPPHFRDPPQAAPAAVEVPVPQPEVPPAPVHILHPEPPPRPAAPGPSAFEPERPALVIPPAAHGSVSAPQFPSPAGPHVEPAPPPPPTAFAPEPVAAPEPFVPPSLREAHAIEPPPPVDYTPEPEPEPEIDETYEAPLGYGTSPEPAGHPATLFSAATDHSVASAFNMLAASRLADNSDELLAMTREMIRPILKAWLDDNLPSMVERLVRAEIERVSRGGR